MNVVHCTALMCAIDVGPQQYKQARKYKEVSKHVFIYEQ